MRNFVDIQYELGLKKFLSSSLGTLYFVPFNPLAPRIMVRHFDSDILPIFVHHFATIMQATQQWIDQHPELNSLVSIEQPVEIGRDFIARPYHLYSASTDAYVDWEDPPEVPEELEQMREILRALIGRSTDPKDQIIETVLARSLLEPTGKTYFDEVQEQFIVVEPKITRENVKHWADLINNENE